jgi:hypothetical protein
MIGCEVSVKMKRNQKIELGDVCFVDKDGHIAVRRGYRDKKGRFAKLDKFPVGVAISEVDNNGFATVRLGGTL